MKNEEKSGEIKDTSTKELALFVILEKTTKIERRERGEKVVRNLEIRKSTYRKKLLLLEKHRCRF